VRCRSGFELLRLPLTAEQLRWLMLAGTLAPLAHVRIANPKKKTFALVNVLVRDGLKVQPRHGRIVLHEQGGDRPSSSAAHEGFGLPLGQPQGWAALSDRFMPMRARVRLCALGPVRACMFVCAVHDP
jgi:hypothetical protein